MNALVLSGGNIKGAYQAGIVSTLLQAGYVPEIATTKRGIPSVLWNLIRKCWKGLVDTDMGNPLEGRCTRCLVSAHRASRPRRGPLRGMLRLPCGRPKVQETPCRRRA